MLAEAELAWGRLLGASVGLTDDDLDREPDDGGCAGWSREGMTEALANPATVALRFSSRCRPCKGARPVRAQHASRKSP